MGDGGPWYSKFMDSACHISASQDLTLSHIPFARQEDPTSFHNSNPNPNPTNDKDDTAWPEFSSPDSPNNLVHVTIRSPPPTPTSTTTPIEKSKDAADDVVTLSSEDDEEERENDTEDDDVDSNDVAVIEEEEKKLLGVNVVSEIEGVDFEGIGKNDVVVIEEEEKKKLLGVNVEKNDVVVKEGKVVEIIGLKAKAESESESSGNAMKCLVELLRVLYEKGNKGKGNENESVDIFETAKRVGMVFPQPRYRKLEE